MNILMTNWGLNQVGGSEKWTYDMAKALANHGHDVDVLTKFLGTTSDHMLDFARVGTELWRDNYDLILGNHTRVIGVPPEVNGFRIYTSHGPQHPFENPNHGADVYVGVSEEVVAARRREGEDWRVVTNGVDLNEFYPAVVAPSKRKALVACKSADACNMAAYACEKAGIDAEIVHYTARPVWSMSARMRAATFLIGIGRTAAEALACGLDVLLFNEPGPSIGPRTDGWITADNADDLRKVNFSARRYATPVNLDDLIELLGQQPQDKGWQRPWAEAEADIVSKAGQYLSMIPLRSTGRIEDHDPDLTTEYEEAATV